MRGWKEKLVSAGGKEILLKAVVQAIPMYIMSYFSIPSSLCEEIQRFMNKFWWSDLEGDYKIHQQSWNHMAKSKFAGGMGFKHLHCFNLALLAKQGWRLISSLGSLCAQVLKAKYYPHSDFLHAKNCYALSYLWRTL